MTRTAGQSLRSRTLAGTTNAGESTAALREHLLHRLGYGGTPDERERYRSLGPRGWIHEQLASDEQGGHEPLRRWELSPQALVDLETGSAVADLPRGRYLTVRMLLERLISDRHGLASVLRDFWFNHFNIYAYMGIPKHQLADYLDVVITPNLFGPFGILLRETATHPAMLQYLDNRKNHASPVIATVLKKDGGTKTVAVGPNQNYARELLELHTLGVNGGYTQADVLETARVMSGYSSNFHGQADDRFEWRADWHDDGVKTVLGQRFPVAGKVAGFDEIDDFFAMLSTHSSTASHIARKLSRRFVGEDATSSTIDRTANAFRVHGGDTREVLRALLGSPQMLDPATYRSRLKPPHRFVVSAFRTMGIHPPSQLLDHLTAEILLLGDAPFFYGPPTGFPDHRAFWLTGDGMIARAQMAQSIARDPAVLAAMVARVGQRNRRRVGLAVTSLLLPAGVSANTATVVRQAVNGESGTEAKTAIAIELLLSSPEFMRY